MLLEISRRLWLLQTVPDENGSMADLRTLTDHPRFSTLSHKCLIARHECRKRASWKSITSHEDEGHGASCSRAHPQTRDR
jgi:hypothetical protein